MKDTLVIGGDSMIGRALVEHLAATDQSIMATTRRHSDDPKHIFLDLAAPIESWPELPLAKTWIIMAAIARLADCRKDPTGSYRVNVLAVAELARLAKDKGARVIFLSSDKAFDGTKKQRPAADPTCPKSEYGQQKAAAEKIVLDASPDNLVIRLSKVLSSGDALFTSWCKALASNQTITPFTDATFAPVDVATVINGISRAIAQNVSGILQFSGPDDITYANAAYYLANTLGANEELLLPVASAELSIPPDERPAFTSLDTSRAKDILKMDFPAAYNLLDQFSENIEIT